MEKEPGGLLSMGHQESDTMRTSAHTGLRLLTNGPQNWEIILDFPGGHDKILQEFVKVEGKDRREKERKVEKGRLKREESYR